ncbi:MAG: SRPBCC family protein [Solirubrobacterales bacterium]
MAARGTVVVSKEWVKLSPDQAWEAIVPCDLPTFFTGMKPAIPAISEVTDQAGDWDGAGQTRTIHLADGSSVSETIDEVDRPGVFRYTVGPFNGALDKLVEHAKGEFIFEDLGGGTSVRWTYDWKPRPGMRPVVIVLAKFWSAYSRRVLTDLIKAAKPPQ